MSFIPIYSPIFIRICPYSLPIPAPSEKTGAKIPFGMGQLIESTIKKNFRIQYTTKLKTYNGFPQVSPFGKCSIFFVEKNIF